MSSIQQMIEQFGDSVTVTRSNTGGSWVNGYYQGNGTTEIETTMSIQPLNGRELINMPEAQRTKQYMKGYSYIELFVADEVNKRDCDIISYDGKDYEVQSVEKWKSLNSVAATHYKVLLAEVNP